MEAVEISRRLSQGPTVIKNERFTDLLPKPTTSKKVSPLHGIYAEQYHHCTPITRRKGRKSWGLGGRETLAVLLPQLPRPQEISHTLKYDRPTVSPLHPNYTPQRPKERGAWGERSAGASLSPNSPEVREISHTLKYDRLKLPSTFFYGQIRTSTDTNGHLRTTSLQKKRPEDFSSGLIR